MPTKLTAHEQPISRIFSDDYVFRIPPYQRPYAWTTEQARELFDDLVDFMRSGPGDIESLPPYFLGSIVLIKPETSPEADVVDGQQRLITLTLLFSAIRANSAPGAIPDRERDCYTRKWESIEEDLGRDAFGELFSHIRMIYRKAKPKGTLLSEFKECSASPTYR